MIKSFNIEVKIEDFEKSLANLINSPYAVDISKLIVYQFIKNNDAESITMLHKAFTSGITQSKFNVGDEVLIPWDNPGLPTWRMHKQFTHDRGFAVQSMLKGKINEINVYKEKPLSVIFNYADDKGDINKDDYWICEEGVILNESVMDLITNPL